MPNGEKLRITEVGCPLDEDLDSLKEGLRAFNCSKIGDYLYEKIACFVKSESGVVLGGAYGLISWDWLHVEWLWCHKDIRAKDYGSRLLLKMETYARKKGAKHVKLETADFQALDFYLKQGYEIYAELPDCPPGYKSYLLKKSL